VTVGSAEPAVRLEGLGMVYPGGVRALSGIDLEVRDGEFLAVLGLSGSGKSTLLRCINRLINPTEGRVFIFGREATALRGAGLRALRRQVAMIFQQFNLVKRHTVLANVLSGALGRSKLLPSLAVSFPAEERQRAIACLERVGLADRAASRADALSGGQQQRVAIARALMQEPRLILADEPTGALDSRTSVEIMALLQHLNGDGMTIVLVTHENDVAAFASRRVMFRDGRIVSDERQAPTSAAEALRALDRTAEAIA